MAGNGMTSIDRALAIVEAFRGRQGALTLQELANKTGLNKATIIRLIASLEKYHYILKVGQGRYSLGPAFLELASTYQNSFHLAEHIFPILTELSRQTGQSAAFFVRDGNERVCIYKVESQTSALIPRLAVGDRRPILPSGTGKILMAFSEDAEERAPWADITNNHYTISIGDRVKEVSSIAAPVFELNQELSGALSVSGPTAEFTDENIARYLPNLLSMAAELTTLSGGNAAPLLAAKDAGIA